MSATKKTTTTRSNLRTEPSVIGVGDIMSYTQFVSVVSYDAATETLRCRDVDSGRQFDIIGSQLVATGRSADQYDGCEVVSQTALIEKLVTLYNTPFTAEFVKQDGTQRVIRARLLSPDLLRGRSTVEDLDIADTNDRIRQIDHRTLASLIVNGVKYAQK